MRRLLALDRGVVVGRRPGALLAPCRRSRVIVRSIGQFHALLRLGRRIVVIGGPGRRLALRGFGRLCILGGVGQLGGLLALDRRRIVVAVMSRLAAHALDRALDQVGIRIGIGQFGGGRLLVLGRLGGGIVAGQLDAVVGGLLAVRRVAIGVGNLRRLLPGSLFLGSGIAVVVQDFAVASLGRLGGGSLGAGGFRRRVIAIGGGFGVRLVFRRGPGGARCHQHGGQDSQGNPGQQSPRFPVTGQA